jgi:hypothetical protein
VPGQLSPVLVSVNSLDCHFSLLRPPAFLSTPLLIVCTTPRSAKSESMPCEAPNTVRARDPYPQATVHRTHRGQVLGPSSGVSIASQPLLTGALLEAVAHHGRWQRLLHAVAWPARSIGWPPPRSRDGGLQVSNAADRRQETSTASRQETSTAQRPHSVTL